MKRAFRLGLVALASTLACAAAAQFPNEAAGRLPVRPTVTVAEIAAQHEHELEQGIQFPKIVRGNPARKEVALTFDDGPHGAITNQLLDILKAEGVPATFFLVGRMVDRFPQIVQREEADGHEVANHTYDHLRLPLLTADRMEWELREGARAIESAIGSAPRLFRPPGGEYDPRLVEVTKKLGYVMVLWTDDPADYVRPKASVIEDRVLRGVENGSIVLLHDGIPETLSILPDLIRRLRERGFHFVTVSQMAREPGVIFEGGPHVPLMRPTVPLLYRAASGRHVLLTSVLGVRHNQAARTSLTIARNIPGHLHGANLKGQQLR